MQPSIRSGMRLQRNLARLSHLLPWHLTCTTGRVPRTYTYSQVESAVAISGDLHAHLRFDEFATRHEHFLTAAERWQLCIDAALELEATAQDLAVEWGETHDYYLAVEMFVDEIVQQTELDVSAAIRLALSRSRVPLGHSP